LSGKDNHLLEELEPMSVRLGLWLVLEQVLLILHHHHHSR